MAKISEKGSVSPLKPSGRPVTYGPEFVEVITESIKRKRAEDPPQIAAASYIQREMIRRKLKPIPTERWITNKKREMGAKVVEQKEKPALNKAHMKARLLHVNDMIENYPIGSAKRRRPSRRLRQSRKVR